FDVVDEDFDLYSIPENSVCYTGTHDNDTTIGWFLGSPDDIRSDDEIRQTQQAVLQLTVFRVRCGVLLNEAATRQ
ncbi:MAG: 4-alpha-glucanotransferase, partial [Gammaproteobacteria bacterium]